MASWQMIAAITLMWLVIDAPPAVCEEPMTNSIGMKLLPVAAGTFQMGTDLNNMAEELVVDFPLSVSPRWAADESPRHPVRLTKPFHIAEHEVTVAQFRRFVEVTGYRTTAECTDEGIVGFSPATDEERERTHRQRAFQRRREFNWRSPGFPQQDSHPVVGVSWEDAQAFCEWLSKKEGVTYRLPTEAEWEYACRAGSESWFSFGNRFRNHIHKHANLGGVELERKFPDHSSRQWLLDLEGDPSDDFVFTSPVGSFEPNSWGLYDMHGNVWEWCADAYQETYYRQFKPDPHSREPATTDTDPLVGHRDHDRITLRVIRGGCWYNGPLFCRSATRAFFDGTDAACYVGFRVVRD